MKLTNLLIGVMVLVAGMCGCVQPAAPVQPSQFAKIEAKDELAGRLAKDPVAVLREGLDRYNRDVTSYTCTLYKQERVNPQGPMGPNQKMLCKFMGKPFSVFIDTVENPIGARKILFIEGKWDNKMLTQPVGIGVFMGNMLLDPRAPMVRTQTLQFVDQFGIKRATEKLIHDYKIARGEGILTSKVLGADTVAGRETIVYEAKVTEPRPTGRFEFPHVRIWLDRQWLLPVGIDIWDAGDIERGRYRYTDVNFKAGLTAQDFLPEANGMRLPKEVPASQSAEK